MSLKGDDKSVLCLQLVFALPRSGNADLKCLERHMPSPDEDHMI